MSKFKQQLCPVWLKTITIIMGFLSLTGGVALVIFGAAASLDVKWGMVVFGIILFICGIVGINFHIILDRIYKKKYMEEINQKITKLSNNEIELSVSDFLRMRNQTFGGQGSPQYVKDKQFPGVYILFNKTKNMYYVGQAQYIFDRVNAHFTGKGNGDVYADYKYGDEFTIKMISLKKSGYRSLNELERHTIMTYNAFSKGYNKTRGNF